MKLISMTDFVLEQDNKNTYISFCLKVLKYAQFLKQPLTLGMFVPCDEEGNVLEEPTMEKYGYYSSNHQEEQSGWMYEEGEDKYYEAFEKHQQAKERVLFEGFELKNDLIFNASTQTFIDEEILFNLENIENLITYYDELTLTETAIKQIGL
ncbi:hypothetical protein [Empedobacter brevis]|uniref:hypothetical protein n=1 Tax=Empedobacter brevis TaxID=247 RepID=UPI00333EFA0D